jgi:DNA gyrase subunit A
LRRLAALERQKIEDEHKQTLERIAYLEDLLESTRKILELIKNDLSEVAEKYGDERRTRIAAEAREEFKEEDLFSDESVLISVTQRGYIKRVAAKVFRAQARGGRGVTGHTTRDEDEVVMLFPARTLDTILFFSDRGKVYSERAFQIPDADRSGKGISIYNVLSLDSNETITAALALPRFSEARYCLVATRRGRIKRMALSELASVRPSGLIAINLERGDELWWARLTDGDQEVMVVSERGQALRFSEQEVRPMGRSAGGVTAIRLGKEDRVASMDIVEPSGELLVVTARGYGKRSALSEYPAKSRATGGVATIDRSALDKTGRIVAARVVKLEDDLTIISGSGLTLRTKVKQIKSAGRATRGARLIELKSGDRVASVARISEADLRSAAASTGAPPGGNGAGPDIGK